MLAYKRSSRRNLNALGLHYFEAFLLFAFVILVILSFFNENAHSFVPWSLAASYYFKSSRHIRQTLNKKSKNEGFHMGYIEAWSFLISLMQSFRSNIFLPVMKVKTGKL